MTLISLAVPEEKTSQALSPTHPPFDSHLLIAIDQALKMAWEHMCSDEADREIIENKGEVSITQCLRKKLNNLRIKGSVDGYNCLAFERPYSGAEFYNYKGEKVRKPDLIFAVSGNPRPGVCDDLNDAIFVECKLVDSNGGKNVGLYCSHGLIRFIDGSYAWRMNQGMMIAYVRTGQQLPEALIDGLNSYGRAKTLKTDGIVQPCKLSKSRQRVYLTDHKRSWKLPEGMPPGKIQVRHLWLHVFPLPAT